MIEFLKHDLDKVHLWDSIYITFKSRQNESMALEVRLVVTCGERLWQEGSQRELLKRWSGSIS